MEFFYSVLTSPECKLRCSLQITRKEPYQPSFSGRRIERDCATKQLLQIAIEPSARSIACQVKFTKSTRDDWLRKAT
jgi:hypothetical protein